MHASIIPLLGRCGEIKARTSKTAGRKNPSLFLIIN
jgi:hypothetical protein